MSGSGHVSLNFVGSLGLNYVLEHVEGGQTKVCGLRTVDVENPSWMSKCLGFAEPRIIMKL